LKLIIEDHGYDPKKAVLVTQFARCTDEKRAYWSDQLRSIERGSVALWGAGAKGATFLNVVPDGDAVGLVIDVNPRKHGKFIPGTGQRIAAPDALRETQPKAVILTNAIYRNEVECALHALGTDAAILVA
jgi:hypothetical protein